MGWLYLQWQFLEIKGTWSPTALNSFLVRKTFAREALNPYCMRGNDLGIPSQQKCFKGLVPKRLLGHVAQWAEMMKGCHFHAKELGMMADLWESALVYLFQVSQYFNHSISYFIIQNLPRFMLLTFHVAIMLSHSSSLSFYLCIPQNKISFQL